MRRFTSSIDHNSFLTQFLVFIGSLFAVITSHSFEIFGGALPCKLCLYQRYLYSALVIISLISLILDSKVSSHWKMHVKLRIHKTTGFNIILHYLIPFIILSSITYIAIFHVGVERAWWHYNSNCVFDMQNVQSFEEYTKMLEETSLVSCNVVQMYIFGLSLTCWSAVYAISFIVAFIIMTIRNYNYFLNHH